MLKISQLLEEKLHLNESLERILSLGKLKSIEMKVLK